MARFFLHLHECDVISPDVEGREFADAFAALRTAKVEARSVMADEVLAGRLCLDCYIRVVDATTGESIDMPFRDAITLSGIQTG